MEKLTKDKIIEINKLKLTHLTKKLNSFLDKMDTILYDIYLTNYCSSYDISNQLDNSIMWENVNKIRIDTCEKYKSKIEYYKSEIYILNQTIDYIEGN